MNFNNWSVEIDKTFLKLIQYTQHPHNFLGARSENFLFLESDVSQYRFLNFIFKFVLAVET